MNAVTMNCEVNGVGIDVPPAIFVQKLKEREILVDIG